MRRCFIKIINFWLFQNNHEYQSRKKESWCIFWNYCMTKLFYRLMSTLGFYTDIRMLGTQLCATKTNYLWWSIKNLVLSRFTLIFTEEYISMSISIDFFHAIPLTLDVTTTSYGEMKSNIYYYQALKICNKKTWNKKLKTFEKNQHYQWTWP